eukprot:3171488-Rhodomonas_salina.1
MKWPPLQYSWHQIALDFAVVFHGEIKCVPPPSHVSWSGLRACYAMSGTDMAYDGISLRAY